MTIEPYDGFWVAPLKEVRMAKWENEDLTKLDLRIIIERLRGTYRNTQGPVTYQPSLIELEAARRLELCFGLIEARIDANLVMEMAQVAYEAANEEANKEHRDWELPSWDKASHVDRMAWMTGVVAGVGKFLNSLTEGGVADGIMGSKSEKVPGCEKESEARHLPPEFW